MKSLSASFVLRFLAIVASVLVTTQMSTRADSIDYGEVDATTIIDEWVTETADDDGYESGWAWYPLRWTWWTVMQTICAVLGVLGNGLVTVIIFQLVEKIRSTDTLIGSLAIADLLTSLFLFPIPWAKSVPPTVLGKIYCKLLYQSFMLWLCITASTYILMAICIERYVAVVHPFFFRRAFSKRRVSIAVALIWVFSFIQCVYTLFIVIYDENIHYCRQASTTPAGRNARAYFAFAIRLAIPVSTMLLTHICIARSLHTQSKRLLNMVGNKEINAPPSFHVVARNRVIKMTLIVVLVYVITWMPNQIAYFCFNLGYIPASYRGSPLHRILTVIGFLNSCANPFIYTSRHPEFRAAVKAVFTCTRSKIASIFGGKEYPHVQTMNP